ncbi:MAG: ribosomal protein L7/L12 [Anaerolineae bacterium]|nr:ribosomal protein L7/L12 [Anaerolineae bacterium]
MSYADYEYIALRRRVEKLERLVARLMEEVGLERDEELDPGSSSEIVDLACRGEKLEAIKLYRQKTGAGLKEAKEFVESLEL